HCHQKAKACIGLTNEKIKNYVMKSPSGFGGSKSIIKAAQTLFPNKFFEVVIEKDTLNVRSTSCFKFTPDESQICYNCKKLEKNKRFISAINMKHATSSTFKYIPKHLLKNKIFSQLMTNESFQNLFSLAQSDKESNMWAQLADFGRRGLLSNSSREYLIFKNMLAGMDLRSICYLRSKNEDLLTNPNLTYEN
ncbi:4427_t:CDS:2, partial [Entrophospora sp. SA101]